MRPIPTEAVDLVARFEGCRLTAYFDSVHVLTIGYGHTGTDVTPGLRISQERARELLRADLQIAARRLADVLKPNILAALSEGQYAALLSLGFNIGANKGWTIWKVANAGQFEAVPAQIRRFVNAGGKRLNGLVKRRDAEAAMFEADIHAHDEEVPPSSVTRSTPTPPTPEPAKPLTQSKTFMTAGATAVTGAAAAVTEVSKTIAPFAAQSDRVANIHSALITVLAVLAVATLVFAWLKQRSANR